MRKNDTSDRGYSCPAIASTQPDAGGANLPLIQRLTLRRREFAAMLGGAAAAGMLPGHAVAQAAKKGGVLKVSAPTNPSSLDPATGGSGQDHAFLYPIFDTLVEWDYAGLQAKPGIAASWKFPDAKTLVLELQ